MFRRILTGFAVLLGAGAVLAQAYKWIDEDGVVHYSDRPQPGAEQVELPKAPPRSSAAATMSSNRVGSSRGDEAAEPPSQEAPFRYESLTIASPAAEETLWNIEGVLNVSLDLRPALQPGHRVRVYFDGEPQMVRGTSFQLEEVWRGVHNLQAEVLDETGKLMIRSVPNRFYIQQNSINMPR